MLQPYNIRVAHKPISTLRRLLTNVKDKSKPEDRQGEVYKIKCCDCQVSYIGETGRNLSTRLTEHKRATRNGDVNNHIAEHHLKTKHQIDWDCATCVTYSTDYSGTRLIRTPRGHAIVSILSGCPYYAGSQRKRQEHMFYRYEDQSRQFYENCNSNKFILKKPHDHLS